MSTVDRNSREAIYSQISRALASDVRRLYKPGDYLPPEHVLAERFLVNRHTVRRAVDDLIAAGLLDRRHGKGTLVINSPVDYTINKGTRFTQTLEALGRSPQGRLLRKEIIPATRGIANQLMLQEGEAVTWIEVLRLVDARPFCVSSHYLSNRYVGDVIEKYKGGSLHSFLRRRCGLELERKVSLISSTLPRGDDARLLSMSQQQPVLRVKSVNVNKSKQFPVEYVVTRFRSDLVQLRINP